MTYVRENIDARRKAAEERLNQALSDAADAEAEIALLEKEQRARFIEPGDVFCVADSTLFLAARVNGKICFVCVRSMYPPDHGKVVIPASDLRECVHCSWVYLGHAMNCLSIAYDKTAK